MLPSVRTLGVLSLLAASIIGACASDKNDSDKSAGNGGTGGAGGTGASGGSGPGGGSNSSTTDGVGGTGAGANGGSSSIGGSGGTGGSSEAGGSAGTAGDPGTGGSSEAGGSAGAGGESPVEVDRWLAFRATRPDYTTPLYVAAAPSGAALLVAPDVETFQWSSDGTRLLYTTSSSSEAPNAAYLVPVTAQGLGEPELIHPPLEGDDRVLNASLSPDGQALAFQVFADGMSRWYVRAVAAGADGWRVAGYGAPGQDRAEPDLRFSWSPEGDRFALVEPEGGTYDLLHVLDATGVGTSVSFENLLLLGWSPDGTRLLADGLYFADLSWRALFLINSAAVYDAVTISEPGVHNDFAFTRFAPDGSAVAFKATMDGEQDLFVKLVDSTDPAVEIDGINAQDAQWFASSEALVYWGYGPPDEITGPHLYAVPKQGGDFTQLNPGDTLAHCNAGNCIRRAGASFVFTTLDGEQTGNQLYQVDLESAPPEARALSSFSTGTFVDSLSVAPTSTLVLVIVTDAEGDHALYSVNLSAEQPSPQLLVELPDGAHPYTSEIPWSPDAKYFYYGANPDRDAEGTFELFIGELTGDTPAATAPVASIEGGLLPYGAAVWQP